MSTFFDDSASHTDDDTPQPAPEEPRTLPRPTGPSWSTIALGLICLVVAGGTLLIEFTEVTLEWDRTGPLALMALGGLLVLVGLAALVRRGDDEEDR